MTPQSAKAKGRKLQQDTIKIIRKYFYGLEEDDLRSTSMGAGGEDVQMSPKAKKLIGLSIECKNQKAIAVYNWIDQAVSNAGAAEPVVVAKANKRKPIVIVDAEFFFKVLSERNQRE